MTKNWNPSWETKRLNGRFALGSFADIGPLGFPMDRLLGRRSGRRACGFFRAEALAAWWLFRFGFDGGPIFEEPGLRIF